MSKCPKDTSASYSLQEPTEVKCPKRSPFVLRILYSSLLVYLILNNFLLIFCVDSFFFFLTGYDFPAEISRLETTVRKGTGNAVN